MAEMMRPQIDPGGLLRCCILTAERRNATGEPPREGEILRCDHCGDPMVLVNNTWKWDRRATVHPIGGGSVG
jgi:hypothetical protein